MSKTKNKIKRNLYVKKKTKQGAGKFTKTPATGGEKFVQGYREGSPPSKLRRRKPNRGQGK